MEFIMKVIKSPITWIVGALTLIFSGIIWAFTRK